MGRKANRVLIGALAVSLAAHLILLGSAGERWFGPAGELAFPIEARLTTPEPARPARPARMPAPGPSQPPPPPDPAPTPAPEPAPAAEAPPPPPMPATAEPVVQPATPVPAQATATAPAPPVPPKRPRRRSLPDNLTLHYAVQSGEGDSGFVAGHANYIWHSRNGRYSLVSTVEATGLAALFVSGRIIQVSEGTLDEAGLRPDLYWLQRNERRQDVARFNWDARQLVLEGRGGASLLPQAQDLLSFPFHLAMTAVEGEADFLLGVTNGRKFNEYAFRVQGRERMEARGQALDTLHLRGTREGEGALDVWLDLGRNGLPVRIRSLDRKGKVMELRLEGAAAAAG